MTNWIESEFAISCSEGEAKKSIKVSGLVRGIFGINRVEADPKGFFVITHIPTGFKVFNWTSLAVAQRVADYLVEKYERQFQKIEMRNEKPEFFGLDKKIAGDKYLRKQWQLFGIPESWIA